MPKLSRRFYLVAIGVGIAILVVVAAVLLRRGVEQVAQETSAPEVFVPRQVDEKYLSAASDILTGIDISEINGSLEESLAYAWANYEYYLSTGDKNALARSEKAIQTAKKLASQKTTDDTLTALAENHGKAGLACVLLKAVSTGNAVSAATKQAASDLCDAAADDLYITEELEIYHQRLATGQNEQQENDGETSFYNDAGHISDELSKQLQTELLKFAADGSFSWPEDEDESMVVADLAKRRQLYAAINKYYRMSTYDTPDLQGTNNSQVNLDRIDWIWLTGETMSWFAQSLSDTGAPIVFDQEDQCLLYQNVAQFLRSSELYDINISSYGQILSQLNGYQTPVCQMLGYIGYDGWTERFDEELNYTVSQNFDEPTLTNQIFTAGLLAQEPQDFVFPGDEELEVIALGDDGEEATAWEPDEEFLEAFYQSISDSAVTTETESL